MFLQHNNRGASPKFCRWQSRQIERQRKRMIYRQESLLGYGCMRRGAEGSIYKTHIFVWTAAALVMGANLIRSLSCGSCRTGWAHLLEESIQLLWICLSSVRSVSPFRVRSVSDPSMQQIWILRGMVHLLTLHSLTVPICYVSNDILDRSRTRGACSSTQAR